MSRETGTDSGSRRRLVYVVAGRAWARHHLAWRHMRLARRCSKAVGARCCRATGPRTAAHPVALEPLSFLNRPASISVVTAVHPAKTEHLTEAYASLLVQSGIDWEWSVQVDGAAVTLPEALVADRRVDVSANGSSMGTAITRNRALLRVNAPVVTSLDADDLIEPGALAALARALDDNPDAAFVWGGVVDFAPDGTSELARRPSPYPLGRVAPGTIETHWLETGGDGLFFSGIGWRTDVLLALGGWSALPGMEDTDLVLHAGHHYAGVRIADVVQRYRIHRDQTTLSEPYMRERERNRQWIWRRACARLRLSGRPAPASMPPDPSIGPARARAARLGGDGGD